MDTVNQMASSAWAMFMSPGSPFSDAAFWLVVGAVFVAALTLGVRGGGGR